MPFSFLEMKQYYELNNMDWNDDLFYSYLKWGGFPLRFDYRDDSSIRKYLVNLYEGIVNKDIVKKSRSIDKKTFMDISLYILSNAGKELSTDNIIKEYKKHHKEVSRRTIYNYLDRMKKAAEAFVGTHDFKAVRSVGTETKTTVRTVHWCDVSKQENLITVAICADGFLYNMCRAIVGTLVYASYGKLEPEEIPALLQLGDRRLTGPTMPPQGLYMNRLWYDGAVGEMMMRNGTPDGDLLHPMIK